MRRFYGRRDAQETLVFLERVTARWLRHAGRYVLIPNQERYPHRLVPLLRHIDHVFCKSEHARQVFAAHHPSVHFLGFTSLDRRVPSARPDYGRFLHVAGGSSLKGTDLLLDVWSRHPEWPVLTVVRRPGSSRAIAHNVGWGHYIVEAMSCSAVTVVTDAPPMNELVGPARGVTVPYDRADRESWVNFFVAPAQLEAAIQRLIEQPEWEKVSLGAAALRWFETNDQRFRDRLRRLWGLHCSDGSAPEGKSFPRRAVYAPTR